MDMNTYKAWDYYTLESKTKGELMTEVFINGYHRVGIDPMEVKRFDTYEDAYTEMINQYDAECYNRKDHGYWYIVRHSVVEYMENEEYHRNEKVEPCVA